MVKKFITGNKCSLQFNRICNMTDIHSQAIRSRNMAAVKSKNTKPEMLIRQELHKRGFRYSLHNKKIPGTPDIFLRKYNAAIFVNGCFWHGHDCSRGKLPETNKEFWQKKIEYNKYRDQKNMRLLADRGINVLTVWQCEIKKGDMNKIIEKIEKDLTKSLLSEL